VSPNSALILFRTAAAITANPKLQQQQSVKTCYNVKAVLTKPTSSKKTTTITFSYLAGADVIRAKNKHTLATPTC